MQINKQEILDLIWNNPIEIGKWCGFKDLTGLHNEWLKSFLFSEEDQTLQAHRGSFKTTTLSLFFAINAIIRPNLTVLYFRKTGNDVAEIARQTANIMRSGAFRLIVYKLYSKDLVLLKSTNCEIHTNLSTNIKGASQLTGLGIGTSITGKHADIVVTDDIVNVSDRVSRAERENTKIAYQELQNIKNRGGRFINTGTPWHEDDCFQLMPSPQKYDCYSTGLMTSKQIEDMKDKMLPSLFAANYELRFIASENVIFTEPQRGAEAKTIYGGYMQVDSAFYGEDYTAWSIMAKHDGKYYLYGKMRRKAVDECYTDISKDYEEYQVPKLYNEDNADKGMVAKEMRKLGMRVVTYHEGMNKYLKIVTYLKAIWKDLVFVEGTDEEYIKQICEYYEDAEHDDAPDSAASLARIMMKKGRNEEYQSLF